MRVERMDTLRLLATPMLEEFLQRVGDATARLINMENFRRRKVEHFEFYKLLGSANFHEACRLISDQWKSFLGLLKVAREGRLEPWQQARPPGYRKRDGQRLPIVVVRFDNYRIDLERKTLHLATGTL